MPRVMRRPRSDGDDAADDGAEDGGEPQGEECGVVGAAELAELIVGEVGLRLGDGGDGGEEIFLKRQDLVLEEIVGLRGAFRGVGSR